MKSIAHLAARARHQRMIFDRSALSLGSGPVREDLRLRWLSTDPKAYDRMVEEEQMAAYSRPSMRHCWRSARVGCSSWHAALDGCSGFSPISRRSNRWWASTSRRGCLRPPPLETTGCSFQASAEFFGSDVIFVAEKPTVLPAEAVRSDRETEAPITDEEAASTRPRRGSNTRARALPRSTSHSASRAPGRPISLRPSATVNLSAEPCPLCPLPVRTTSGRVSRTGPVAPARPAA